MCVFVKKAKLPTVEQLQSAIEQEGFKYKLNDNFDIQNNQFSFFMGSFEGLESGFDYILEDYISQDWEFESQYAKKIENYDGVAILGAFANAQEIVAMVIVSSMICKLSGGLMRSDFFFDGEFVDANDAIGKAKSLISNLREQFDGASTTRQAILDK